MTQPSPRTGDGKFLLGAGLIVAVGARNAFVRRQGLAAVTFSRSIRRVQCRMSS
jgi:arginine exporter protein ArgO